MTQLERKLVSGMFLLGLAAGRLSGECPKPGGGEAPIVSNPNRPTVSNPADLTQRGVAEIEYGWQRSWPGAGSRGDSLGGLFRFGLLCDLELRFNSDTFLRQRQEGVSRRGLGDTWTGVQYRFLKQTRVPAMAISYALKQPTASSRKELGSGRADHFLTYLASKDLGGFHADFNASFLDAGRPQQEGRDRNVELALSLTHALQGPLALTGEIYGDTRLNSDTPGFASTLWALSYSVNPRLTLDAAVDFGLTSGAARKQLLVGFTYALGDLYSRRQRP